jgi:hypothetical protein
VASSGKVCEDLLYLYKERSKMIEEKNNNPFVLLEEHFFTAFVVHRKPCNFVFKDLSHETLQFFS